MAFAVFVLLAGIGVLHLSLLQNACLHYDAAVGIPEHLEPRSSTQEAAMVDAYRVREAGPEDVDRVVEIWVGLLDFHLQFDPKYRRCQGAEDGFAHHLRD